MSVQQPTASRGRRFGLDRQSTRGCDPRRDLMQQPTGGHESCGLVQQAGRARRGRWRRSSSPRGHGQRRRARDARSHAPPDLDGAARRGRPPLVDGPPRPSVVLHDDLVVGGAVRRLPGRRGRGEVTPVRRDGLDPQVERAGRPLVNAACVQLSRIGRSQKIGSIESRCYDTLAYTIRGRGSARVASSGQFDTSSAHVTNSSPVPASQPIVKAANGTSTSP